MSRFGIATTAVAVFVLSFAAFGGLNVYRRNHQWAAHECDSSLFRASTDAVYLHLKAPATAHFVGQPVAQWGAPGQPWSTDSGLSGVTVENCHIEGFVDAQNEFSALIRTHYDVLWSLEWDSICKEIPRSTVAGIFVW